jgi:transposase
MKKNNKRTEHVEGMPAKAWGEKHKVTVGLDLGDRYSYYCMINEDGEVFEEGRIRTNEEGLQRQFQENGGWRIAMEAGVHSPWVSRKLGAWGHQVIVANPRQIPALTETDSRNDRNDAENLARFAYCDPRLLKPIEHRSVERQRDLNLLKVRDTLVRARTMMINSLRGLVKSEGRRLPSCDADYFASRVELFIPAGLREVSRPMLAQIQQVTQHIQDLEKQIKKLGDGYPEIGLLQTAQGVGPIIAAAYVLTLDRPEAFPRSRQAGAFLGLRPRQKQSGNADVQCRISKRGNQFLRRLLVQGAQSILGPKSGDSALRRWGLKLAGSGGKRGKKRAVVAVARKLAVILHSMWKNNQKFRPFPKTAVAA